MICWRNGYLVKCKVDVAASRRNSKLVKWQVSEIESSEIAPWQNGKLAKCQVGEMALLNRK